MNADLCDLIIIEFLNKAEFQKNVHILILHLYQDKILILHIFFLII